MIAATPLRMRSLARPPRRRSGLRGARFLLALAGAGCTGARPAADLPPDLPVIRVPTVRTGPVLLDGRLAPAEWREARMVAISPTVRLLVQQVDGHVFLAVATGTREPPVVDLFVADARGQVVQLHASVQVGERVVRDTLWSDTLPPWRWGNHVDWIANEAKLDAARPAALPFAQRLFPADGTEFQLRAARFPGDAWRLRVELRTFGTTSAPQVFPAAATRAPATWARVVLR